jgi:hypothetical protein
MIIQKRKGIYQEYTFSLTAIGWPYRLQFADADNIFMLSMIGKGLVNTRIFVV